MTYTQNNLDNRWLHKYNISFSFSQNKSVKIILLYEGLTTDWGLYAKSLLDPVFRKSHSNDIYLRIDSNKLLYVHRQYEALFSSTGLFVQQWRVLLLYIVNRYLVLSRFSSFSLIMDCIVVKVK